jgi:hypothetical protein
VHEATRDDPGDEIQQGGSQGGEFNRQL